MARNIKMIPSTVPLHAVGPVVTGAKRRVAAYARVSTDRDEQFTSYEAQIDYYTNYIRAALTGSSFPYIQTKERPAAIPASARASRTWWTMPLTGK